MATINRWKGAAGQRVSDLVSWVVDAYPDLVAQRMDGQLRLVS